MLKFNQIHVFLLLPNLYRLCVCSKYFIKSTFQVDIHILFPLISDRCTFTIFALWKQDYIEYMCNMCTRRVYSIVIVSSMSIQNVQFSMNFLFTISGTLPNGQRKISFLSWQFFMFFPMNNVKGDSMVLVNITLN